MDEQRIDLLSRKIVDGSITANELKEYNEWFQTYDTVDYTMKSEVTATELKTRMYVNIAQAADFELLKPKKIKLWPRVAGIAAAVIGLAMCIYFFTAPRHPEGSAATRDLYTNDIPPGGNRATLTTAEGKTIMLSDAKTGISVSDDLKYNDGTLIDPSALGLTDGDSRTLEVAALRGGIYSIILQDGTKAWLNADSKLKFESNYRNKLQRIVKLVGEAYFEVAKDAKRPFIIESNGQRTEVLGTHFNISAYPGEAIKTTLIEGSVRVSSLRGGTTFHSQTLKPNQQSLITENAGITVKEVNPEDAVAWKNGYFMFNNESLEKVMERIARWYNVKVIYEDPEVKNETVFGTISRFEQVSKVLKMLERADVVQFAIEGNTIKIKKRK